MNIETLKNDWIEKHSKYYSEYYSNQKEPRYNLKQFFFQSYLLFKRFSSDTKWLEYMEDYRKIFRRDPNKGWYKYRSPKDEMKAWINSFEWVNTLEIISEVGFPYKEKSVKKNMLRYLKRFVGEALESPYEDGHDFMLISVIKIFDKEFTSLKKDFINWLEKELKNNNFTPHQLMAYMTFLRNETDCIGLYRDVEKKLISWIQNPSGSVDEQVLIWARLLTRLEWWEAYSGLYSLIIDNFIKNFESVKSIAYNNQSIILEAIFVSLSKKEKVFV